MQSPAKRRSGSPTASQRMFCEVAYSGHVAEIGGRIRSQSRASGPMLVIARHRHEFTIKFNRLEHIRNVFPVPVFLSRRESWPLSLNPVRRSF